MRHPELEGIAGELREEYPGLFLEIAHRAGYIKFVEYEHMPTRPVPAETGEGNEEKLDAILADMKLLIQIDPDMRR